MISIWLHNLTLTHLCHVVSLQIFLHVSHQQGWNRAHRPGISHHPLSLVLMCWWFWSRKTFITSCSTHICLSFRSRTFGKCTRNVAGSSSPLATVSGNNTRTSSTNTHTHTHTDGSYSGDSVSWNALDNVWSLSPHFPAIRRFFISSKNSQTDWRGGEQDVVKEDERTLHASLDGDPVPYARRRRAGASAGTPQDSDLLLCWSVSCFVFRSFGNAPMQQQSYSLYSRKKSFIACLLCKFKENIWNVKTQADLYHTCSFIGLRTFIKVSLSCRSISQTFLRRSLPEKNAFALDLVWRRSNTHSGSPPYTLRPVHYGLRRRRSEHRRFPAGAQLTLTNRRNANTSRAMARGIAGASPDISHPSGNHCTFFHSHDEDQMLFLFVLYETMWIIAITTNGLKKKPAATMWEKFYSCKEFW